MSFQYVFPLHSLYPVGRGKILPSQYLSDSLITVGLLFSFPEHHSGAKPTEILDFSLE